MTLRSCNMKLNIFFICHAFAVIIANLLYSIPKVFVSSTANKSFSYKISGVGYGGRSKRLKHVCALKIYQV